MRITALDVHPWNLKLRHPFTISLGTLHEARNALVVARVETDDGRTVLGYGEAAPLSIITGETIEGVTAFVRQVAPLVVGREPQDMEGIWQVLSSASRYHFSGKAAIDIAVHDCLARALSVPLACLLGGVPRPFPTDITIGLGSPEDMADQARKQVAVGFSILKLKLGTGLADDVARVTRVRGAVGGAVTLRVDANQAWTPLEALRIIERIAPLEVELVEQPVAADDIKGMAEVARRSPVPIMADESVFSARDALRLAHEQACHIFNIKLMKCGGLHQARRINAIAEAAQIKTLLGCMLESRISIAAAAHFVAATSNVMGADLDSHLYLVSDPVLGGPTVDGGEMRFTDAAGSGAVPQEMNNPGMSVLTHGLRRS